MNKGQGNSIATGKAAEDLALTFLIDKGLKLVERNYRSRGGEIDLIMEDNEMLIFVEVRYRKTNTHGSALESITLKKQAKLITCASHYLTQKRINKPTRFDAIAVSPERDTLSIEWVPDAFRA
ncbi:MAG: YraN family protein [Methylococcales bacterium]